jgi:hypothetical protein
VGASDETQNYVEGQVRGKELQGKRKQQDKDAQQMVNG